MMQIVTPLDPQLRFDRDQLLQRCLRPEPLPFSIATEYPLVLDPARSNFSHCLVENNRVVAHANLWPRQLLDRTSHEQMAIGLIGNVATDEAHRGQGLMTKLMTHLLERAQQQNLQAILLWSDLDQFYQRLGFTSRGRELRFSFQQKIFVEQEVIADRQFLPTDPAVLSDEDLQQMLFLRDQHSVGATLIRSVAEFREQLRIPATNLLVLRQADQVIGYCIIGRGYDLFAVVHEWGVSSGEDLWQGILTAARLRDFCSEIILLAPASLAPAWRQFLTSKASSTSEHAVALVRVLSSNAGLQQALEQMFVWGMDSI